MVLPRSKIPSGKFKATCHRSGLLVGRGLLYFWRHPTLVHGLFLSHCPPSSNEFDWDHITTSMSLRATWCLAFVKIVMHLCKSITMMIYSCGQVILAANCYYICLCRFHFAIKLLGHSSDTIMCSFIYLFIFVLFSPHCKLEFRYEVLLNCNNLAWYQHLTSWISGSQTCHSSCSRQHVLRWWKNLKTYHISTEFIHNSSDTWQFSST